MREIFLKYRVEILRVMGGLLLVVGFSVHFWTAPKEGLTQNEIAALNVARMEAQVRGEGVTSNRASKPSSVKIIEELKSTQEKQMRYLTILTMILGAGFLGYSFIKKEVK